MINLVYNPNTNADDMVDTNITILIILNFGSCKKSVKDKQNVNVDIIPNKDNEIKLNIGLQYST